MFETIQRGWRLTKVSLRVVRQDKELLMLPVLAGIGLLLSTVLILGLGYYVQTAMGLTQEVGIGLTLLLYFVSYFITIYFNTGLVTAAGIRLDGGDPTLKDAFAGANKRLGKILGWALVAATVGLLLQLLERFARERGGFIGQIMAQMVGMAWNLATYFVIPVIVAEDKGPVDSVKRSASVFKSTWGETITGGLGIGLVFFLLGLAGAGVLLLAVYAGLPLAALMVLVGLVLVYWLVLVVVHSAASQVLVAALYRFATKGDAGGVISDGAAQHLFDRGDSWSRYQDPTTGRIRGA